MSKLEKAKARLRSEPKDYSYSEARSLLNQLGFIEMNKGKTSGSRVEFFREEDKKAIYMHKPHPGDIMRYAAVKQLVEYLTEIGEL